MLSAGMFLGNRYEIINRIGSGGMSDVYRAKCHKLNRYVAIKVLKSEFSADQNFLSKFRMEAQSAACLSHPNIVNIYDVGEDRGIYYIVMELIEGITLKKYIERKKKLEIRESIEVAMQVARGLEAAHKQHIIHRDIKPQNIMISKEGKVKVTDFGIARASLTQTISSNTMGSVHYISPEQARGGYCDERSDIYSLGITLYEMPTGRVPFEGESTVSVALLHIQGEMVPPRQYEPLIPVSLEKIILKCTQKKPELRYASATELIEDLKKSLTMPNENFVKIASLNSDSPTVVFGADEQEQIRQQRGEEDDAYYDEPDDGYGEYDDRDYDDRDYDDRDYDDRRYSDRDYDEDDYDEEEDDSRRSKVEKVVTGVSIGVAILILLIVVVFVMKSCGADSVAETSTEETTEATTEAVSTVATVEMENLLGMTEERAIARLEALGLTYKVETGASDDYEEGLVYEQEYREGETLEEGTRVTIKVSTGASQVTIPTNLEGMSVSEATSALEALGFTVSSRTTEENSDDVAEGLVINTDPSMGSSADKGSTVSLIISAGPATVTVEVPDVTGLTKSKAVERLENLGLKVTTSEAASDDVSEGLVITQSVDEGTEVEEGTSISIVVSTGSAKVTVPNLKYYTLSEAKSALKELGLEIGEVEEEYSDDSMKGVVISQSVDSGESVEKGTSIDIVIGLGAEPTTAATTKASEETEAVTYEDGGDPDDQ
ncbi:MAG: Stk1 family PASTA domain-containing Ser/Thr kinase [Lachnospiraceae bacterium]|nr:Stk1 family PASTA domain-containing Ser/Thr kinase [Lachnospiraceae bacterium]